MTINQTILQHIEAAFQGEVWGIASYRAMMEGQSDPVRRWKWAVLTQLEVETRAAMFDLLRTLGGDTQDREASRQAGLIEAERLLQMDWLTMISAFSADLPGLIAEYSALEKAAQPHIGEATALRKLVQHEKATLAFCEAELVASVIDNNVNF